MQRDWALGLLAVAQIALWMGLVVHNVNQVSFRQALCPSGLFSRMNATMRFLIGGAIIFGALLGGLLGSTTGVRGKLLAGAVGQSLTFLPVFLSPLRRMRELPSFVEPSGRGARRRPVGAESPENGGDRSPHGDEAGWISSRGVCGKACLPGPAWRRAVDVCDQQDELSSKFS